MNREELQRQIWLNTSININESDSKLIVDFIQANFTPKGEYSETEKNCGGCMGPCGRCKPKGKAEIGQDS